MRKVMFQALAIASVLGMSALSASAVPMDSVSINHSSGGALNKTMGDFNTRGGAGFSGGGVTFPAPNRLSPPGIECHASDDIMGVTFPAPNRLSPQPFRPAGRWMD